MKCDVKSDFPVTDKACREATGRTLAEWYSVIDAAGGAKPGRRAINSMLFDQHKVEPWWATTISVEYEKHCGLKKKDGLHEGYFICSTKTINAPADALYRAWTEPAQLAKWYGEGARAEVRDSGSFSTRDGDSGSYLRVRENKDLRFSFEAPGHSAPSLVDVVFDDKGKGKSGLLVNHSRIQTREEADGLRQAWGEALNRLKALLEG